MASSEAKRKEDDAEPPALVYSGSKKSDMQP